MKKQAILVTGANGQIGTELTEMLRTRYPLVIASDIREKAEDNNSVSLDVTEKARMKEIIGDYGITQVYNLAAILSAKGEQNPTLAWEVNLKGGLNVLELAVEMKLDKIFWPSSIAVFGGNSPKQNTPQDTITDPETIYGITKLAGERWNAYYYKKKGVDVRSIRYPGLIGYKSLPGGGTTDYAVEIFHEALKNNRFECFLSKDTRLPMMFMLDAIRATIDLMEAPSDSLSVRSSYNVSGINFTPEEIANSIRRHLPDFEIGYAPDFREEIARSWPSSISDETARRDWGWSPEYDLEKMVAVMLKEIKALL